LPHPALPSFPTRRSSDLDWLGRLNKLRYLNLADNEVATLPDGIGGMTSLRELRAYNNAFRTVPASIGNLRALRELHLQGNRLEEDRKSTRLNSSHRTISY